MKLKVIAVFILILACVLQSDAALCLPDTSLLAPQSFVIRYDKALDGKSEIIELMTKPAGFDWSTLDDNLNLAGYYLGRTNKKGTIIFSPYTNYQFHWPILGFKEDGWRAFIVKTKFRNGYLELRVKLTKNGEVRYRDFAIGLERGKISGRRKERSKTKSIWKIIPDPGRYYVTKMIRPIRKTTLKKLAELDLTGYYLGTTDELGIINISPYPYYLFRWFVLGSLKNKQDSKDGWRAFIVKTKFRNGYLELRVMLTKDGEGRYRDFAIGLERGKAYAQKGERNKTKSIWEITPDPGRYYVTKMIRSVKKTTLKKLAELDLTGYYLGATDKEGTISISPYPDYSFKWHILGPLPKDPKGQEEDPENRRGGWNAFISDKKATSTTTAHKVLIVTVELVKGDEVITRRFQIGARRRFISNRNNRNDKKTIWYFYPIIPEADEGYDRQHRDLIAHWARDEQGRGFVMDVGTTVDAPMDLAHERTILFHLEQHLSALPNDGERDIAKAIIDGDADEEIAQSLNVRIEKVQIVRVGLQELMREISDIDPESLPGEEEADRAP